MRHMLHPDGRHRWVTALVTGFCAILIAACHLTASAQLQVVTQHNDNQRTGANLYETQLNPSNVNPNQFGLLFTRTVDSLVYAQPLYVHKLDMPGVGRRNVLFVATMANSIYAFDADSPTASTPLWHVNLGTPVDVTATFGTGFPEIAGGGGQIGALATPAIDLPSRTIYICCSTSDAPTGPYHTMLHALDITTGKEQPGSPVELAATLSPSTAAGAVHGALTYDASQHMVRPALLLANGVVYICVGSHGDLEA